MPPASFPTRLAALALAHPVWLIALLVLAQHAPLIAARDLWWSDEVRHGGVLLDLTTRGDWWALHLNGAPYTDKPPLYFWFLAGMQALFGPGSVPIFLGLSLTVFAFALSCWHLALRVLQDRAQSLGAVAVLLSGSYVLAASHYARMDFMFAAAIALAWGSFYAATAGPDLNRRAMLAGFAFVTLATLVKGPVGLLLPLSALIVQLALQRRLPLLADRSVLAGLGILAAGLLIWAGGLIYVSGTDYLSRLFDHQIVGRTLDARGGALGYLRYLWAFPAVLLPYSLLPVLPRGNRAPLSPASRYLIICVVTGLISLSLIGEKHEYYLIPLLVPAAILLVRVIATLPTRSLGLVLAGWMAVQGALVLVAPRGIAALELPANHLAPALAQSALPGILALVLALILAVVALRLRHWSQILAACVLAQTLFGGSLLGRVMPALDAVLSPATLTQAMRPAIDQGFAPGIAHGIPGVFAFHLGQHYAALSSAQSISDWLAATPRAVIALQDDEWRKLAPRHPGFQALACVPFLGLRFVVLVSPPGLDAAPSAQTTDCASP
jgi:4-amino-4-deoxy-L-arabinose transferase-like glycosyltransferase